MDESILYIVENIEKSYEIYRAIENMEDEVLSEMDAAIRKAYHDWVDDNWITYEDETLNEDYVIHIIRKEWMFTNDKDEKDSYIWIYLQLEGDDPIWKFFGLPSSSSKDSVRIEIWLSDKLKNKPEVIKQFDLLYKKHLEKNGFVKKGGPKNRTYEMEVLFKNRDILKGLKDDDWDDALKPLLDAWTMFNQMNWTSIKKYLKS